MASWITGVFYLNSLFNIAAKKALYYWSFVNSLCCYAYWSLIVFFYVTRADFNEQTVSVSGSSLLIEADWRIYASDNYAIYRLDNVLSPGRRQAIVEPILEYF